MTATRHRIGFVGAGSIVPTHMRALDSLGRAAIVAICSRTRAHAEALARERTLEVFTDLETMLRQSRPDAVFVCVPPHVAPGICQIVAAQGISFFVEKPVAALDSTLACQVADDVESRGLVAAVGYQLRGLDFLPQVREAISLYPPELVTGRWHGPTPNSEWWSHITLSGGQVVEQMTHFYDLARVLLGDPDVIAAAGTARSTSALVQFDTGAIGIFLNSHGAAQTLIELELLSVARIWLDIKRSTWTVTFAGGRTAAAGRSPYEVQAEAFLDALEAAEPQRVLATYRDGLSTYLLTRSVASAADQAG